MRTEASGDHLRETTEQTYACHEALTSAYESLRSSWT